ncbi:MDR family oxidoreductase [Marinivivus vitaminiproducens]|uniref:MDR family oxidoreductase n=1 Tax=Marinivivus vitaminiproducens TaxID=3035935 RepID=UPI002799D4D8|nr:oxidoreductase [Geminicoccaceae bacterium SCSIO 64248]
MAERFPALVLTEQDGRTESAIREMTTGDLPDGDVLVDVAYTTLNYKDALAITGKGKIIRTFPFVPGIDFSGRVLESAHPGYAPGQEVVLTGWGVGERHWGGMAGRARVKGDWLVTLPEGLDLRGAMALGTAGFTAMLAVQALEAGEHRPDAGEIAVTGASGGVGSVAIALLAKRGFQVTASTGKPDQADFLKQLGAHDVVDRSLFTEPSKAPLGSARFAGAIDTVGGATLAGLLKVMQYHGVVAACGLAGSADLPATVFPFILRGVRLQGIDSVYCPSEPRAAAWRRLAQDLSADVLEGLSATYPLADLPELARGLLAGEVRKRVVIDVKA